MGLQSLIPHKSRHATGGSDALTPSDIGAQPAGSYATLGADNKLTVSQLPDIAVTEFLGACANEAAMLAKTGQKGDWVTRDDDGKVYVITGDTPSQVASWTALSYPVASGPTTSPNSGISVTGSNVNTAYNTSIGDTVNSVAVGGAPAAPASTWKTKNIVQVLDDILFPTILASILTPKSISLEVSGPAGVLEIGTTHNRTLTSTFNPGRIRNGDGTNGPTLIEAGNFGFVYSGTGMSVNNTSGNTLTLTNVAVVSGNNAWQVARGYDAGTGQYFDNKGVPGTNLDASRAASSTAGAVTGTSTPTITGIHPYYYFKSASPITAASMVTAIQNGDAIKVVASSTGTLFIPYATNAEYLAVAYPSTSTTKTRYFVTTLDSGDITIFFEPVATQSVTTALWTQNYRIHVSNIARTSSVSTIELRNPT